MHHGIHRASLAVNLMFKQCVSICQTCLAPIYVPTALHKYMVTPNIFLLWHTCNRLDRLVKMSVPYKWCKTILVPNNGVKINHAETGHLYLNDV